MSTKRHEDATIDAVEGVVLYDGRTSPVGYIQQPDAIMPIPIREEHLDLELLDNDPMTPVLYYGELKVLEWQNGRL